MAVHQGHGAPGLKIRIRAGQRAVYYWVCQARLVKRGYRPKTVRLSCDPTDPDHAAKIAHRCRVLQAEMLEWASGRPQGQVEFDGTFASLVKLYEQSSDSNYGELRPATQKVYSKNMSLLMQSIGTRCIDAVTGADVRRWYKNLAAPSKEGGPARTNYAYLMVSILKAVVGFGASLGYDSCLKLRAQMSAAKFKQGGARKTRITYIQLVAFCTEARKQGRHSMARGLLLQHELAFRARDVIGEWIEDFEGTDGIRSRRKVWGGGLTWAHIGQDGVLRKTTTKTGAPAAHRISEYSELVADLALTPADHRIGPLVISESTGLPYNAPQYRRFFRIIARAAGIPDEIWAMDARAGAVTEMYEAGATTEQAMSLATHTQASTSRRYIRDAVELNSSGAKLRMAARRNDPK